MTDAWAPLTKLRTTDQGAIEAEACIQPDSAWFDGHFPNRPILPGVALLGLIERAIESQNQTADIPFFIDSFRRVKFKKPVESEVDLLISLLPRKQGPVREYSFTIRASEEVVCSGIITTRPDPADLCGKKC
ncbi:hypothetical protein ACFL4G_06530 [Thermodesulfobacteriota bacterium]